MQEQVVGSKEWFQQVPMQAGIKGEGWSEKLKQAFSIEEEKTVYEEKKEGAYESYKAAKSATEGEGYIYLRREINLKVNEWVLKLKAASETIWKKYLDRVQPLDKVDENNLPTVLVKDMFEDFGSNSSIIYDIFNSAFSEHFEKEKFDFISNIRNICEENKDSSGNQSELFKGECETFREIFEAKNEETLKNIASLVVKRNYFNITAHSPTDAYEALNDGRIYQLFKGSHNWLNNLSWMLAHIHKGNSFKIFGQLTNEAMLRSTAKHADELSGFAREVALLTKLNYQFSLSGSTLTLLPPDDRSQIEKLSVEQAYLSDDEVKEHYTVAVTKFAAIAKKEEKPTQVTETVSTTSSFSSSSSSSSSSESNITNFFPSPLSQPTESGGGGKKRTQEQTRTSPLREQEEQKEEKDVEKEPPTKKPKSDEKKGGIPPPTPF